MKESILLVGTLGYKINKLDGQTVKTRNILTLLKQRYSGDVYALDTLEARKDIFIVFRLIYWFVKCKTVVLVPASNSLEKILLLFHYCSKIFKFNIVILCVGGWQIEFFNGSSKYKPHPKQLEICRKIKAFLPEVENVTKELVDNYGFKNCETFTNFRILENKEAEDVSRNSKSLKLVFMARINKLKGYDIIFNFANKVKSENLDITIDFYGPINQDDEGDFLGKIDMYKGLVSYKGKLQPEEINSTLKNYDALLLPTRYYTEGVPGTIIDAYMAKLPVIVTNWKHAHEVVIDGVSGVIVDFENPQEEFNDTICRLYHDKDFLKALKAGTIKGFEPYSDGAAWNILVKYL